jgi:stage II sporulation protein R
MNSICSNATSKEECIEIVSNHLSDFSQIANETILANGFSYSATTELGNFEFPTKNYADITFPSGYYDALEVKLGNADGKNWWCVLYPSLCFIDTTSGFVPDDSKESLEDNLNTESYALISNNDAVSLSFKFKLVEFFNKNKFINTAKN